jgi:RNA polymerase-interacting CarD/CdnL/TRCF family regulator
MIPFKESNNKVRKPKSNKNNLDLNELVRHMHVTKTSTTLNESFSSKQSNASVDGDEFSQLRRERDQLESQLKFQMQVNGELKGLLVHCLGEDIQSKVSNLTEDKMKIAEHLSTNTEKIEFLAGQCEVFRSKFLASSLMVEELAKWKASLSEKNQHLVASNRKLLETFGSVRDMEIELYQNLKFLAGFQETNLKSSNVIDLTGECLNISQQLVLNSGKIGMPDTVMASNATLDPLTDAQKQALNAVQDTNEFLASPDEASKAVCNQASQEYRRVRTQSEDAFEMLDARDAK